MIELVDITKKYGDFVAVDQISLKIKQGEVCVLLGPSGCGKSTTLKMINRMLEPTSGSVFIDGQNVRELKPELLRRKIGYVIQYVGLFPHMTVSENIGIVPKLLGWEKEKIARRTAELLELIGLDPGLYGSKYPQELSGGEAQRIGVARALAADPPILLMDEPFGAVDPLTREILQTEFVKIQRELKKTVVFVTHDLEEAIRVAVRIVLMRDGRLVQHDTPENILAHPKNRFVHDFIGADRALKRLSRFPVSNIMRKAPTVSRSDDLFEASRRIEEKGFRFLWVVDENQGLMGWIDTRLIKTEKNPEDAITQIEVGRIAVSRDSTCKTALSRMLGEGIKVIPVVDESLRVIGEISLADIEKLTEEVSHTWQERG
ncbi:MAG: glycine betaine ABC transporter ATP-binding protein [Spirochaetes bacterium DG_61]|nr:MAG: glycine betaine ABC transporter ATP-binding protein [Spirochaetes bacterium DG_61]